MKFFVGFLTGAVFIVIALYLYFVFPIQYSYNPLAQYDLNRLCRYTTNYDWGDPQDPTSRMEKEAEYIVETSSESYWSNHAKNLFEFVMKLDKAERWKAVQEGAREIGLQSFECPALKNRIEKDFFEDSPTATPQKAGASARPAPQKNK